MTRMNSYGEFVADPPYPWEMTVPNVHGTMRGESCPICHEDLPKGRLTYCSAECASEAKRRSEYKRRKGGYTWRR